MVDPNVTMVFIMVYHGLSWFTMVYHGFYHGLSWFTMVYHG